MAQAPATQAKFTPAGGTQETLDALLGSVQQRPRTGLIPALPSSMKMLIQHSGGDKMVFSRSPVHHRRYVAMRYRNGQGEGGKSDVALKRVQAVFDVVEAWSYKNLRTDANAATADVTLGGTTAAYDGSVTNLGYSSPLSSMNGSENRYLRGWELSAAATITVANVIPNEDGMINIGVLPNSAATTAMKVEWSYDGGSTWVTLEAAVRLADTVTNIPRLWKIPYRVGRRSGTLRVTNSGVSGNLRIVAVNIYSVGDGVPNIGADMWAWIRTANYYVNNSGASEYAIRYLGTLSGNGTDRYVGSYHGEEPQNGTEKWLADLNEIASFTDNVPIIGKNFRHSQQTRIAGAIDSYVSHEWAADGAVLKNVRLVPDAGAKCDNLLIGMQCAETNFSRILYPLRSDHTVAAEYPLGRSNLVIQEATDTGQRIYSLCSAFTDRAPWRGGSFLKHRDDDTSDKVYFGAVEAPTPAVPISIPDITFQVQHIYA